MAFMGMVFAGIFLVLFFGYIGLIGVFFILALILKIMGKKKDEPKLKKAGTVFLVLGIVFVIPVLILIGYLAFSAAFWKVQMPDGKTEYVSTATIEEMKGYVEHPDDASLDALDVLLTRHKALAYYQDNNHESILDYGLKAGNAELVEIALAHGAVIDSPERYDNMSYVSCTMESFLAECNERPVTEDDIRIAKILFEHDASLSVKHPYGYSNLFGKAAWAVLYNDNAVTDTELALVQVFAEHGLDSEPVLMQELNSAGTPDVPAMRNANYHKLMQMIGKEE